MSRNPYLDYAEAMARAQVFEPWESPPRRRGPRRPTLANAMKQAAKAGIQVASAMFTPEGVKLELSGNQNGPTSNPWDAVQ